MGDIWATWANGVGVIPSGQARKEGFMLVKCLSMETWKIRSVKLFYLLREAGVG